MIGSIIGDAAGSIYEFDNIKTKNFPLLSRGCSFTDDSVLSFATADWLLNGGNSADYYLKYTLLYPNHGYGSGYWDWACDGAKLQKPAPAYDSCGNGSAMRVGPVGWAFDTDKETMAAAKASAICTHNHPEGIIGAQATAMAIFWARKGMSAKEIGEAVTERFGYDLTMSVAELQERYSWRGIDGKGHSGVCQDSVPQSIICALEATDFEDAIRNAVSIGGDSDTIACIAGSIAEALFGVPRELRRMGEELLPAEFMTLLKEFEGKYGYGR